MKHRVIDAFVRQLPLPENIRSDIGSINRDPIAAFGNLYSKAQLVSVDPGQSIDDNVNKMTLLFAVARGIVDSSDPLEHNPEFKRKAHEAIDLLEALDTANNKLKLVVDVVTKLLVFVHHCAELQGPASMSGGRCRCTGH